MTKNLSMIILFIVVLILGLYFISPEKAADGVAKAELIPIDSSMKKGKALFSIYHPTIAVPDIEIKDEQGNSLTLQDLSGQNLLVNFWATWCIPCREEMPELDALQAARGNDDFKVVIISVDRGGVEASRKFLNDIGIKNLDLYYDEKGVLARKMKSIGYPSTVLVTKDSEQFGILTGPAHWNSGSAHSLIDRLISGK